MCPDRVMSKAAWAIAAAWAAVLILLWPLGFPV